MNVEFTRDGWDDFEYWLENDLESVEKIRVLIKSIKQTPFSGLGKPEPLKHRLKGFWSRRISGEHRLVYQDFRNQRRRSKVLDRSMQIPL